MEIEVSPIMIVEKSHKVKNCSFIEYILFTCAMRDLILKPFWTQFNDTEINLSDSLQQKNISTIM